MTQIIGAVIDVEFSLERTVPSVYDALLTVVGLEDRHSRGTAAVGRWSCENDRHGLHPRELKRGLELLTDTKAPISVPVGASNAWTDYGCVRQSHRRERAPSVRSEAGNANSSKSPPGLRPSQAAIRRAVLETGIKVIDLMVCPFAKGGKVGLFGELVLVKRLT
jgi:F0F1-type ATP synthase beta subunit